MEMETSTASEDHIEYVELLDPDVYDQENGAEIIEIHDERNTEDPEEIMHEIVTITDENDVNMIEGFDEIQYVEAEVEVEENSLINHDSETIFIHDGRKYVISTDQLNSGEHTIILDEEDGQLIQQEDDVYYTSDIETPDQNNQQFAVLKDGKLHLTNIESDKNSEAHEKLRQFESTLTNYDELNDDQCLEHQQEEDENDKQLSEITGKNLITGQTISLSGILEKMKRKTNVNDLLNTNTKQSRNTINRQSQNYILVPPVTRRVVVGRTQDGKRLVGRILQIQKKIQPNSELEINQSSQNTFSISMPTKRNIKTKKKQPQPQPPIVEKTIEHLNETKSNQNQIMQLRYLSRSVLDENVARTLAGLMDLESINKRLKGRRLIVRHIQRRSHDGKIINGSKKVAYYCGRLKRQTAADNWTFIQEYPTKGFDENGIDLPKNDTNDIDKVNLRLSDDGRTIICNDGLPDPQKHDDDVFDDVHDNEIEETINLYLTETQDEYGKKKTKVTIPQFIATNHHPNKTPQRNIPINEDYLCKFCGKKFQTYGSLKRHSTVHDHSLRPLQCMTCLGRFTDESSLKKHMILHTGLRPHKCHLCDKNFAHRGDLNFHLRTHDPVKRYECKVCKKQFNRHSNMMRHAEIHRPQYNNNKTTQDNEIIILDSSTINEEFSEGPGGSSFTCDQCGIQYNYSSSLTRHIVNVHLKQTDE